ncbi:MAG: cytochrome peroxidase [Flavipsychrobacter sp.]|jgi:cytochrome c peroxidase|nr:cytochrome peroxidase [Flavipsychrobacter sp.]
MKKIKIVACIVAVIAAIHACKKKSEGPVYNPTAAKVEVPTYVKAYLGEMQHPADNPLTAEGVELGRKLFYEKMLSNDNSISCASCHKQEFGFDDPAPFSKGTNGTLGGRNAMAIINLGYNTGFFWDGRRNTLEGQAHDPVTNPVEMANTWPEVTKRLQNSSEYRLLFFKAFGITVIDSNHVVKAIAQFERTMISFDSRFDRYYYMGDSSALNSKEKSGLAIFTGKGMCNDCHRMNTLFTDNEFRNNGLDVDPKDAGLMQFTGLATDRGKFKVPTLRNIFETAPYMHDSRFKTLEQVVSYYSSGVQQTSPNIDEHMPPFGAGLALTTQEQADLVAFLKALSDPAFLTNTAFSEPK